MTTIDPKTQQNPLNPGDDNAAASQTGNSSSVVNNDEKDELNLNIDFGEIEANLQDLDKKDETISDFGDFLLEGDANQDNQEPIQIDDFKFDLEQSTESNEENKEQSLDIDLSVGMDEAPQVETQFPSFDLVNTQQTDAIDENISLEGFDTNESISQDEDAVEDDISKTEFNFDQPENVQEEIISDEQNEQVVQSESISQQEVEPIQSFEMEEIPTFFDNIDGQEQVDVDLQPIDEVASTFVQDETVDNQVEQIPMEQAQEVVNQDDTETMAGGFSFSFNLDGENENETASVQTQEIAEEVPTTPSVIVDQAENAGANNMILDFNNGMENKMENTGNGGIDLSSMDIAPAQDKTESLESLQQKLPEPESVKDKLTKINASGVKTSSKSGGGAFIKRFVFLIILGGFGFLAYSMMSGGDGKASILSGLMGNTNTESNKSISTGVNDTTGDQELSQNADEGTGNSIDDTVTGDEQGTGDTTTVGTGDDQESAIDEGTGSEKSSDVSTGDVVDEASGSEDVSTGSDSMSGDTTNADSKTAVKDVKLNADNSTTKDTAKTDKSSALIKPDDTSTTSSTKSSSSKDENATTDDSTSNVANSDDENTSDTKSTSTSISSKSTSASTDTEKTIKPDDVSGGSSTVFKTLADKADKIYSQASAKSNTVAMAFAKVAKDRSTEAMNKLEKGENMNISESQKYIQKFLDSATNKLNGQ